MATSTLGLLVGLVIHVFKVQPFIATLAAMFLARGLCYIIAKESISIAHPFFVLIANLRIPLGFQAEHQSQRGGRTRGAGNRRLGPGVHPLRAHRLRDRWR